MTDRPNLTQLSKEIYEANKLKGWHDKEYSNEHYLCLVISELMEAVEADRLSNKALLLEFQKHIECNPKDDANYSKIYNVFVKDSIEDELADAVIRLLDLAGVRGIEEIDEDFGEVLIDDNSFTENIIVIVDILRDNRYDLYLNIECAINNIELLCQHLSIDLWLHVSLKLKYNLTRPYKHGKEY